MEQWLFPALVILGAITLFFTRFCTSKSTVTPVAPAPSPVQQAQDAAAVQKIEAAEKVYKDTVAEEQKAHDTTVKEQIVELKAKEKELEEDPASLNAFLKDIGVEVRKTDK